MSSLPSQNNTSGLFSPFWSTCTTGKPSYSPGEGQMPVTVSVCCFALVLMQLEASASSCLNSSISFGLRPPFFFFHSLNFKEYYTQKFPIVFIQKMILSSSPYSIRTSAAAFCILSSSVSGPVTKELVWPTALWASKSISDDSL